MKSDYSDQEILKMILGNFNFTDELIREHLNSFDSSKKSIIKNPTYVERDARAYREFISKTYFSKDREDPFTHFYVKEAAKQERVK